MERIIIHLGDCTLTMVHIPSNGVIPGFYVSEIPVTMQQYKALGLKNDPEWDSWIDFYEKLGKREYEDFTIASALTVENVVDFINSIRQPVFYCLPSREQWLHLAENHYNRVKWCFDSKYSGICDYKAICWEMTRDNSFGIYCLLGFDRDKNGNRIIKGNNFAMSQERDNIAFRLVCSEIELKSYYNI